MWFRRHTAIAPARRGESVREIAAETAPRFRTAVAERGVVLDPGQQAVVERLCQPPAHGFYMWGGVGRGKSMLADLYLDSVPDPHRRRFHVHRYFRILQAEIVAHREPLETVIARVIGEARVVLFDEFHVHDVADAIYLTKTLEVFLDRGILLLATSNYAPDALMPNPLFHERFLPAIALIEEHLEIVGLHAGRDYRGTVGDAGHERFSSGAWIVDAGPTSQGGGVEIEVNGLRVCAIAAEAREAVFTFADLCDQPLGVREFLQLADDHEGIRLVDVPDPATADRDALVRLCTLIDVLYDRDRRLEVVAAGPPERMLEASEPPADADRALSRLATLGR